jgi:protein-S-isoprenylcysteine O-methyltransferase Ste14
MADVTAAITFAPVNLAFVALVLFLPVGERRYRPVAAVYVAFVLAASLLPVAWIPDAAPVLRHCAFLALGVVGAGLILAGWARLYRSGPELPELIEDGIYRILRHPQYAGFVVLTLGVVIRRPAVPAVVLWVVLLALLVRLAREEDRELERRFGRQRRNPRSRGAR